MIPSLFALLLYYFFPALLVGGRGKFRLSVKAVLPVLAIVVAANIVIFSVLTHREFIYYWDYAAYWMQSINVSAAASEAPLAALRDVCRSVNTEDYNQVAAYLLAVPLRVFGQSFVAYALLIFNLFLVPALLVLTAAARRVADLAGIKRFHFPVFFALLLLQPMFTNPMMFGYIDAAALLPLSCVIFGVVQRDWERPRPLRCFAFAVLFLEPFVLRRYFIFAIAALGIAVLVRVAVDYFAERDAARLKSSIATIGLTLVFVIVISAIFLSGLISFSLHNDYQIAYSAYSMGGIQANVLTALRRLGWLQVALVACGIALLFRIRQARGIAAFFICIIFITIFSFSTVQQMGVQHYYTIIGGISVSALLPLWDRIREHGVQMKTLRRFAACGGTAACFVLLMLNYAHGYFNIPDQRGTFLLENQYTLKSRQDIDTIHALVDDVNALTADGKSAVVIASSGVLNDDILRKSRMPEQPNAMPNLLTTSHVDLRDGFPEQFMCADLLIVADPPQTHLGADSQRVVVLLSEMILLESPLQDNYQFMKEYALDEGVTAKIYEKTRQLDDTDIGYMRDAFNAFYADYPELFADRIK
jgi:hypothetical protein